MNIQIFARKKCFESQKAQRWFKERGIRFQLIDIDRYGISPGELDSVRARTGLQALIHTEAKGYAQSVLRFTRGDDRIREYLLADFKLIRTPIVRNGRQATIGYQPDTWESWQ